MCFILLVVLYSRLEMYLEYIMLTDVNVSVKNKHFYKNTWTMAAFN